MKASPARWPLLAALGLLLVLHNDFWQYDDASLVLGLPVGLTYHIAFCVVSSILMVLFVRFIWPSHLESGDDEEGNR